MDSAEPKLAEEKIAALRRELDTETHLRLDLERQLGLVNAQFEEFISMAAHNMREPLRDVAAFSQLLAENYAGVLDSEATGFLDRVRQGAASAQSILADVVDYWAIGTGGGQPSRTDMEAVLSQALLRADRQIAARHAVVTHDALPSVMGDFEILTKVLHHLIGNAIAYGDPAFPRVHISSIEVEPEAEPAWRFSVRDNGPGIEPAFQGRIFGAFKRLHGREYPGNGLGLAFCRKAVESLGGRMSVESAVGSGATFYFTVPAA
jgi:chemotaxis family two-component system sensor kinase Cph1